MGGVIGDVPSLVAPCDRIRLTGESTRLSSLANRFWRVDVVAVDDDAVDAVSSKPSRSSRSSGTKGPYKHTRMIVKESSFYIPKQKDDMAFSSRSTKWSNVFSSLLGGFQLKKPSTVCLNSAGSVCHSNCIL